MGNYEKFLGKILKYYAHFDYGLAIYCINKIVNLVLQGYLNSTLCVIIS